MKAKKSVFDSMILISVLLMNIGSFVFMSILIVTQRTLLTCGMRDICMVITEFAAGIFLALALCFHSKSCGIKRFFPIWSSLLWIEATLQGLTSILSISREAPGENGNLGKTVLLPVAAVIGVIII